MVYTDSQKKMMDTTFKMRRNWILHEKMTTTEILEKFPIFLRHPIEVCIIAQKKLQLMPFFCETQKDKKIQQGGLVTCKVYSKIYP